MAAKKKAAKKPLTAAQKKKIPKSDYGLPRKRGPEGGVKSGYPMPDASHARNAKARASQQYKKGNLSKSQYDKIVAMANKKIKAAGGKPTTKRIKK